MENPNPLIWRRTKLTFVLGKSCIRLFLVIRHCPLISAVIFVIQNILSDRGATLWESFCPLSIPLTRFCSTASSYCAFLGIKIIQISNLSLTTALCSLNGFKFKNCALINCCWWFLYLGFFLLLLNEIAVACHLISSPSAV